MTTTTKPTLILAAIFSVLTLAVGYFLIATAARHDWHDIYASTILIPFALALGLWLGLRPRQ